MALPHDDNMEVRVFNMPGKLPFLASILSWCCASSQLKSIVE